MVHKLLVYFNTDLVNHKRTKQNSIDAVQSESIAKVFVTSTNKGTLPWIASGAVVTCMGSISLPASSHFFHAHTTFSSALLRKKQARRLQFCPTLAW
jgi:hypothetical protein